MFCDYKNSLYQCLDNYQKPSVGVPIKRCSENMHQVYRRTHMPKCDFNKVT